MLVNWGMASIQLSLSIYLDGVWWNIQYIRMLKFRSSEYSLAWYTIMGGMKHCPSDSVKKLMCTGMVLSLQFSPSKFVHPERTCKYRRPCSTFHWDKTQFHHSSIPEWLLVENNWVQKGYSYFSEKVACFQRYIMIIWDLCLLCWTVHVLAHLW